MCSPWVTLYAGLDKSGESGLSPSKHELIHGSLLLSVDKMGLATLASRQ